MPDCGDCRLGGLRRTGSESCRGDHVKVGSAITGGSNGADPEPAHLDAALDEPSLLSLIPAAVAAADGAFLLFPHNHRVAARVPGRFWSTPEGNVYTRLELNVELIRAEMEQAIVRLEEQDTADVALRDLHLQELSEYLQGDEYQLGLAALLRHLGVVESDYLIRWWFGADHPEAPPAFASCLDAVHDQYTATKQYVATVTPDFVVAGDAEEWTFPVEDMYAAIEDERSQLSEACSEVFSKATGARPPDLVFQRDSLQGDRLEILFDDGLYADPSLQPVLTLLISDLNEYTSPPLSPKPVALFTPISHYVTKISECGSLPWVHSTFAGGDSYYPPEDPGYPGPFLAEDLLCQNRVPDLVGS